MINEIIWLIICTVIGEEMGIARLCERRLKWLWGRKIKISRSGAMLSNLVSLGSLKLSREYNPHSVPQKMTFLLSSFVNRSNRILKNIIYFCHIPNISDLLSHESNFKNANFKYRLTHLYSKESSQTRYFVDLIQLGKR